MYHYIYKTTNILNGCYYIGKHSFKKLKNDYLGSGTYLKNSVKKYGKDNFKKEILLLSKDLETNSFHETLIVNEELLKDPLCMNLIFGGTGNGNRKGYEHTEEAKRKNREAHLGKHHSLETRKKISQGLIEINKSEKVREKKREDMLGNKHGFQKNHIAWNKGIITKIEPGNKNKKMCKLCKKYSCICQ